MTDSSITLSERDATAPELMTCMLAAEALADSNDHGARTGTGLMHYDGRIQKNQMASFVRGLARHDRRIRPYPARQLVSVPRWHEPLDRRARPASAGGLLLLNLEIRGDTGAEWPGPHQEFVIDLALLREAVAEYAYADGRDGEIGEDEVYALTWSCLAVLSHPRGWYPVPFVSARDNMLAVCRKAADVLLAQIRGGIDGAPDPAWTAAEWLRDGVMPDKKGTPAGQLYTAYEAWCGARGYEPATIHAWGRELTKAGYPVDKRRDGRFRGLRPRVA